MSHPISCIIISNTDDFRFLYPNLEQIKGIFKRIVIALGNQLWNGEEEDSVKLTAFKEHVSKTYANIDIVDYNIPKDEIKCMLGQVRKDMYWEGHARWIAYNRLIEYKDCEDDYIMYLDSDEIVNGATFKSWLDTNEYKSYDVLKLKNYWYWREPIYRAQDYYEDSVVLVKNKTFNPLAIFDNKGRHGLFDACKGTKIRNAGGDSIFIHHYSWVRGEKEMINKVKTWGHRNDRRDWVDLVKEEFSRPFSGTDFLRGFNYDIVSNVFNIK